MAHIVVGVDGSESSMRALDWATGRAGPDDVIEAVAVWAPMIGFGSDLSPSVPDPAALDQLTRGGLETAVTVHQQRHPDRPPIIKTTVLQGHPGRALSQHAADADLLVVGRRGSGGFTGLHLGSVSTSVTHHARCPTAVVP
ncbi:MAG: universal stress protein [Actinomycetota bacterium]